jgi:hypothetical protein
MPVCTPLQMSPPFLEGALVMGERLDVLLVDRAPYAGLPTFKAMLRLCVATNNMKRGIALHKAMMQVSGVATIPARNAR